jgi:hypothetical protein
MFRTVCGDDHVIFDSDSAEALKVYAGLDGYHHILFQNETLPTSQPRHLVHFQAKAVTRAVREVLIQLVAPQNVAGCAIDLAGFDARLDDGYGGSLGFQDGVIEPSDTIGRAAQEDRTRHIAAVAAQYSTLVHHDQLVFPE